MSNPSEPTAFTDAVARELTADEVRTLVGHVLKLGYPRGVYVERLHEGWVIRRGLTTSVSERTWDFEHQDMMLTFARKTCRSQWVTVDLRVAMAIAEKVSAPDWRDGPGI